MKKTTRHTVDLTPEEVAILDSLRGTRSKSESLRQLLRWADEMKRYETPGGYMVVLDPEAQKARQVVFV